MLILARRAATVVALTLAVIVGASLPASATFADAATVSTSVTTLTVAAPTGLTVSGYCSTTSSTTWDATTSTYVTTYSYWYTATVTWPASTTPRGVSGYRVTAYLNNGTSAVMGTTDAATRTMTQTADRAYLSYQPRISVSTLTSYGWTAESAKSAVLAC